jgi:hypothetical protein
MYRYQVWNRDNWGRRNGVPDEIVYSLDQALIQAKAISKKAIYVPNAMIEPFGPVGANVYPTIFVLDCCQAPSRLRGFAYKGKWRDAIDNCNSCHNMAYGEDDCKACGGACWSPYRK